MKIITKQTLIQEITHSVQQVYTEGKEVDYIEVSVDEYNELIEGKLLNELTLSDITLDVKNSNGNTVKKVIQVKRMFDYTLLDYKEFKAYFKRTYPTIEFKGNIRHKDLLELIPKDGDVVILAKDEDPLGFIDKFFGKGK